MGCLANVYWRKLGTGWLSKLGVFFSKLGIWRLSKLGHLSKFQRYLTPPQSILSMPGDSYVRCVSAVPEFELQLTSSKREKNETKNNRSTGLPHCFGGLPGSDGSNPTEL
jgi:hypothetical protein